MKVFYGRRLFKKILKFSRNGSIVLWLSIPSTEFFVLLFEFDVASMLSEMSFLEIFGSLILKIQKFNLQYSTEVNPKWKVFKSLSCWKNVFFV